MVTTLVMRGELLFENDYVASICWSQAKTCSIYSCIQWDPYPNSYNFNKKPWHKACHDSLVVIQFGDRYVQVNNDGDILDSGI